MHPTTVEASTLRQGERIQIPGEKPVYDVDRMTPVYVHLTGPKGEPRQLHLRTFVFLIESPPAPITGPLVKTYPPAPATFPPAKSMTTHLVRLNLLSLNPALATVPMMSDVAARLMGAAKPEVKKAGLELSEEHDALFQSLDRDGILEPLKCHRVGRKWIVDDGRHRLEWAANRGVSKVPIIEVTAAQGTALIETTVVGRRHWTKGQRAYMGVILHPEVASAPEGRPAKNGDSVAVIATAPELGKRIGVSKDTVLQACELYRRFFAPGAKPGSAEAIEAESLKAKYEVSIWAGAGLGAVLAGIGGGQSTDGKPRPESGFHGLEKPLATLSRFSQLWTEWDEDERAKGLRLMTQKAKESMSPEFRLALSEALAAAEI